MPLAIFSKAITAASMAILCPVTASRAKPAVDTAWKNPNIHRLLFIPSFSIITPPANVPPRVAQKPNNFTMVPISDMENPISR